MKTRLLKIGILGALLVIMSTSRLWAFTAVVSGDWSNAATWGGVAPGPNVTGQDIIIPNGITVNLDMNVNFSGLINTFTVNGTLNSVTTNSLTIDQGAFAGNGTVDIHRLEFHLLATSSFTGSMVLNVMENDGALLSLAATGSVSDSLLLSSGSITLNTGANLAVQTNSTIRRDAGSITIGGGIFNSSSNYHVVYVGGSKTSGIELNSLTLQNVYIQLTDNTQTLTLGSDLRVYSTLYLTSGHLDLGGNNLELYGNMNITGSAMFESDASSDVTVQSAAAITSSFVFQAGSVVDVFTVDHTGGGNVKLGSALDISGELRLNDGSFSLESGSTLTMSAGSLVHVEDGDLSGNGGSFVGTAAYDVEYMGGTNTSGLELTGSGLNDVDINLASAGQINMNSNAIIAGNLDMANGKINLNGYNLVVNGTMDQVAAATIIGNSNSDLELHTTATADETIYFDGSNQNLESFVVDVTGSGNIVLGSQLHINDELNMVSGKLDISDYDLIIEQGGMVSNYSDTKYIITSGLGQLQMYVNLASPYLVFPVGTSTNYSPASVQQVSGATAGNFMVNVFNGVFTGGLQAQGYNSATTSSVVNRTWIVEAAGGVTINTNLKLGWVVASEVNGFDRTDAYISHYTAGDWDTYASAAAVAGLNNTFEISRTGLTSLSPFAVADVNAELIVDDEKEVLTIHLYPNPCTDVLNVAYSSNTDQYMYQIIDLTGKMHAVIANGTNTFDVSGLTSGMYLLKITNLNTKKVAVEQFIKK